MEGEIEGIRDVVNHKDCEIAGKIEIKVAPHAVCVYRVKSESTRKITNKDDKGEFVWKPIISINMETAEKYIKEENALLVDVRMPEEYEAEHIEGAINVPYTDVHGVSKDIMPDKDRTIIVYCSTGKRSSQAKMSLEYLGYKNIFYLKR